MAPNSFTLDLPSPQVARPGLYSPSVIRSALEVVVDAWQPQWAGFTNAHLSELQRAPSRDLNMSDPDFHRKFDQPTDGRLKMPLVGWISYLRHEDFPELPLKTFPPQVTVRDAGEGAFLTIGNDPLAVTEQDVITVFRALERPFHPWPFTGVSADPSFDPPAYQAQVTSTPPGLSYRVNGYAFHAYKDGRLLYVHDQYTIEASNGELMVGHPRKEFLALAQTQLLAAQGYPIVWFFSQPELSWDVKAMLAHEGVKDIAVRFIPCRPKGDVNMCG